MSHPIARQEALLVKEAGGELVVYDLARDQAHSLNAQAALVWRQCDGHTPPSRLVELLQALEPTATEDTVERLLAELEHAKLLDLPKGAVSRRAALVRAGGTFAAAVAVLTIAAPHAQAQASKKSTPTPTPTSTPAPTPGPTPAP